MATTGDRPTANDEPSVTVWTIGHSVAAPDTLCGLLRQEGVEVLVDVRTTPYSKYVPQANREVLGAVVGHGMPCHRRVEGLVWEFQRLRFEAYAPVRRQLLSILPALNRARKVAGLDPVPVGGCDSGGELGARSRVVG